jgi:hypothetical protein
MFNEVNLEHITEAHDARNAALDHYERTREFQERQEFEAVDTYIRPRLYDNELDRLRRTYCKDTGRWLQKALYGWLDPADATTRLVWLQGIPGAGKCRMLNIFLPQSVFVVGTDAELVPPPVALHCNSTNAGHGQEKHIYHLRLWKKQGRCLVPVHFSLS